MVVGLSQASLTHVLDVLFWIRPLGLLVLLGLVHGLSPSSRPSVVWQGDRLDEFPSHDFRDDRSCFMGGSKKQNGVIPRYHLKCIPKNGGVNRGVALEASTFGWNELFSLHLHKVPGFTHSKPQRSLFSFIMVPMSSPYSHGEAGEFTTTCLHRLNNSSVYTIPLSETMMTLLS